MGMVGQVGQQPREGRGKEGLAECSVLHRERHGGQIDGRREYEVGKVSIIYRIEATPGSCLAPPHRPWTTCPLGSSWLVTVKRRSLLD